MTETVQSFIQDMEDTDGSELVYCGDENYGNFFILGKADNILDIKDDYEYQFGGKPRFTKRIKKVDVAVKVLKELDTLSPVFEEIAKITGWKIPEPDPYWNVED